MKNDNIEFVSTEIDLDRDVPSGPIDEQPDEPVDMPGFEGTWKGLDGLWTDSHFDAYCDAHPDFNDAMNGMINR